MSVSSALVELSQLIVIIPAVKLNNLTAMFNFWRLSPITNANILGFPVVDRGHTSSIEIICILVKSHAAHI